MKHHIKNFFGRRRNWWIMGAVIVIAIAGYFFTRGGGGMPGLQTGVVERRDLQETVLATGQVVSGTDLDLGFVGGGIVRGIMVKEGDRVSRGQLLAYLDRSGAQASLTTAQGSLAQVKANYEKLVAGATPENIRTYENSVASATQDLANAYGGAVNTLNNAYTAMFNAYSVVSNTYNTYFSAPDQYALAVFDARNDINIRMQDFKQALDAAGINPSQSAVDDLVTRVDFTLSKVFNDVEIVRTQTDQGAYYLKVSATDKAALDTQKTNVNSAATNVATLRNTLASLKVALRKAQDQLVLAKAPPTQAEIASAKAQILSAEGQVAAAQAQLNNLSIVAPSSGVVTAVNVKVGEQASSLSAVITLQDVGDLHTEADISEANIAALELGQQIDYTFDALGPDRHFAGSILTINPSSTVISGIVNYKIKGSLENVPQVKPGMTVNMAIMTAQRQNALAVASTAVVNRGGVAYVRVLDDAKTGAYHEVQVRTGLQADGGLVEILSGLQEGQAIVTYLK